MSVELEVLEDPARACAALMVSAALSDGHIVLTGGSTPKVAYQHFVEAVHSIGIDVSRTTFWMGDERCVDPDDERSNYRMIKESLLDPLAGEGAPAFHRMRGELGPEEGAADYERIIEEAGRPRFDLVLLGIGPDGHCASLFPGQPTLGERGRLVIGVPQAGLEPFVPRISMTIPALVAGPHVAFLATGESKADAISRAFGPDAQPTTETPSSLLAPEAEQITVLMDHAAAAKVPAGEPR